jgi:sulfite reductase (NADPH) flavoprotein alpha-component
VPPTDARRFCDWLAAAAPGQLGHLSYSVCALGDSAYTHFCRCGRALDAALAGAGAAPLLPRADVDKEDWRVVDGWIEGAVAALLQQADSLRSFADLGGVAASGLVAGAGAAAAAAAAAHASSGYSKSVPYYARVVSVEGLCVLSSADDKDTVRLQLALEGGGEGGLRYAPGDALGIWPTNPPQAVDDLLAALGASGDEAVPTPAWHYREQPAPAGPTTSLRHALSVAYDIKSPKAKPLLAALQAPLQAALAAAAADAPPPAAAPPPPAAGAKGGARASIELQVDATAAGGAGRAHGTSAGADAGAAGDQAGGGAAETQSQLSPLAASAAAVDALLAADAAALERYLAPRHVADMLEEASGGGAVRLAPAVLLGALRPLAPRLYSISSSPLEYSPANSGVAATIAVVRYTSLGRARRGVASTHVGERLSPGQALPVFISPNPDFRLPRAPTTPLIMVGPGTGLAPFRAFILQRLLERSSNQTQTQQQQQEGGASSAGQSPTAAAPAAAPGPMHLFFGCRRRDQDFLYGQQLTAWHECGAIRLHTAFSREGAHKVCGRRWQPGGLACSLRKHMHACGARLTPLTPTPRHAARPSCSRCTCSNGCVRRAPRCGRCCRRAHTFTCVATPAAWRVQ